MGTIRNKLPNNIKYPDKLEKLKAQGLEGESLAIEYNRFIRSSSLKSLIERHGEDWYIDLLIRKTESISKSSDISTELFESVYEKLDDGIKSSSRIYFDSEKYKKSEYKFYMHDGYSKIISVDFYLKDKNKVVEFYGNYWHKNPKYYSEDDEKVRDTHLWDDLRIIRLKEKYGVDILIIWEDEYKCNKIGVVNKIINYLNS